MAGLPLSSLLELNAEGFDPLLSAGVEAGAWAVQVPLVHWIVGAIRPRVLVELGSADSLSYAASVSYTHLTLPTNSRV